MAWAIPLSPGMSALLMATLFLLELQAAVSTEYCWETFNASCAHDEVVVMRQAKYGRMKLGRCVTRDYLIGCSSDVLAYMDRQCSGRHACQLDIPDTKLHRSQPCPQDIMAYLDADYDCVKVAHLARQIQCGQAMPPLGGAQGYIANIVTESTGIGSHRCPWIVKVSPGQKINITLLDFSTILGEGRARSNLCPRYATIREEGYSMTDITVCGGEKREKPILLSESNTVEIAINNVPRTAMPYFLLKYQATGCPDPKPPELGWAERQGDKLTLSCNNTGELWHLVCSGNTWVGEFHNCTTGVSGLISDSDNAIRRSFPISLVIAVVIGIVLGVLIGLLLLAVVLYCNRRMRRNQVRRTAQLPPGCIPPDQQDVEKTRILRSGNYGYAHVWELQQLRNSDPDVLVPSNAPKPLSADPGEFGVHLGKPPGFHSNVRGPSSKDHAYESPCFPPVSSGGKPITRHVDSGGISPVLPEGTDGTLNGSGRPRIDNGMEARYTD